MDIKDCADPFIDLANARVVQGLEPEQVGDGMLYGTARYMAFLIGRAEAAGWASKEAHMERLTTAFKEMIEHHLEQLPHPCSHPEHHHSDVQHGLNPSVHDETVDAENPVALAAAPIIRGFANLDVVLVAFLRGQGKEDVADSLLLDVSEMESDPDWDIGYARRLYVAMAGGSLPEALAIATISTILTPRMISNSPDGYLRDPEVDEDARKTFAQSFASCQLHKLATMVRKDIKRFMALEHQGTAELLGPRSEIFRKAFEEQRHKHHH